MAERRMFSKKITDADAFIELSSAAQALYFHLNQGADDDGFNNQIQNAMFKAHASLDDMKILLAKNFVIRFESGVIVIKHWRMHNTLRKDRYTPTSFKEEFEQLGLKDNGAYTIGAPVGCQLVAERLPQDSIGKDSIDKDNPPYNPPKGNARDAKRFVKPTVEEVAEYCTERQNNIDPQSFIDFYESKGWKIGSQPMKDWKAAVRTWEQRRKDEAPRQKPVQKPKSALEYGEKGKYGSFSAEDALEAALKRTYGG